jgi:hypothetical protein
VRLEGSIAPNDSGLLLQRAGPLAAGVMQVSRRNSNGPGGVLGHRAIKA